MIYVLKDKNLSLLFITGFLFFLNEALLLPTLPIYLSELGYSNLKIGFVLGAFALGVLILRPAAALLTDRKSRKGALYIGLAVFLVTPVFYLFSDSFIYLLCVRFFHGIGIGFYTTAAPTIIADISPEDCRGEVMGHMAIASNISYALGPLVGITMFREYGLPGLVFTCIFLGLASLVLSFFISETFQQTDRIKRKSYKEIILKRVIIVASIVLLFNAIIIGGVFTYLPILLNEVVGVNIGIFFAINSGAIILFRFFTARLSDRYGRGPIYFFPFISIVISMILIAKINGMFILVAAALLNGFGCAICFPALAALMADCSRREDRGSVYSFFYGAFDIGMILAGVILGGVADLFGIRNMFLIAAGLGLVSLIIFTFYSLPGVITSVKWTILGNRTGIKVE